MMRSGVTAIEDSLIGVKIGVIAVEGFVLRSIVRAVDTREISVWRSEVLGPRALGSRASLRSSPPCPPTLIGNATVFKRQ